MSLLAFRDVTVRRLDGMRKVPVLDRVSFELDERETAGVLAARGAGKTTLLQVAAGLQAPDEGEVSWRGRDLASLTADERARVRRHGGIALARGDWRASASKQVLEHVAMPLYSEGLSIEAAERCAAKALDVVKAPGLALKATGRLGLAERLRVELARALVREPTLLLVDEPAVLPQPGEAAEFYELLHLLPKEHDISLLIASEELSALRGAGRVRMMNLDHGRLHSTDSRRKVIAFPDRRHNGASGAGQP
ncbi:MAG TPA: ATP-binding cassette domain-containing protein [Solirubrobacteraceae bacterium]|nr:ATP-binding cassette domain-containing protein [Solirubrobacteraceae bacterium]